MATRTVLVPFRARTRAAIVLSGDYDSGIDYAFKGRRYSPAAKGVVDVELDAGSLAADTTGSFVVEDEIYDVLIVEVTIADNEGPVYVDVEVAGDEGVSR
jgi:hypothetical protein